MTDFAGHQVSFDGVDASVVLAALPDPVLVINSESLISWVNPAAEDFFGISLASLENLPLETIVNLDSPLIAMIAHAREIGAGLSERRSDISGPRIGSHSVDVRVSHIYESPGYLVISFQPRSIAEILDRQLIHRGAARSVIGMAHLLAHEVKNPLSGIRGAAQLLEQNASKSDKELTQLIQSETDRICSLVDNMDQFAESGIKNSSPVNLHEVLAYVRRIAAGGFGRHVRFIEHYDPSLPPAAGNKNSLIQIFLNLVKNAAEAVPPVGGEIILKTAYRQKVRVNVPGAREKLSLPLEVKVSDNGPGIPNELHSHLFEAFVTNKPEGSGLGLALAAKLVRDHGGIIEFEQSPATEFTIRLPVHKTL